MDTLNKYKGKYVCYASNELGTAVSNEAILNTDGKSTLTTHEPPTALMKDTARKYLRHFVIVCPCPQGKNNITKILSKI